MRDSKIAFMSLLFVTLLSSCAFGEKFPEPKPISFNISDYNGIYELDSLGKEFEIQLNGSGVKHKVTKKGSIGLKYIEKASTAISEFIEEPVIEIEFNEEGTKIFYNLTKKNIGQQIALIFNNKMYACPMVQSEIKEGKVVISGNFSKQEVADIVAYINENN